LVGRNYNIKETSVNTISYILTVNLTQKIPAAMIPDQPTCSRVQTGRVGPKGHPPDRPEGPSRRVARWTIARVLTGRINNGKLIFIDAPIK